MEKTCLACRVADTGKASLHENAVETHFDGEIVGNIRPGQIRQGFRRYGHATKRLRWAAEAAHGHR